MDSRSEHAEKTRPVDPSLVSCLTGYSAMRTRQAERRWITIGREDASDGFRCSGSLSHWHCPCCCLVLPLPPPNGQRDKSLRSSPLEREWAGNERTSIKQYEEAFTDFIALPQVPRHLGYRRGWDGPPCSRSVAVLRCKLSKPLWSLLR